MDTKIRRIGLGAITIVAAGSVATAALARDEVRIPSLTAPFGAGITEQVVIFERLIAKRHPWVRLVAQESPGFVYNVKEMANNKKRYKTTTFLVFDRRIVGRRYSSEGLLYQADSSR